MRKILIVAVLLAIPISAQTKDADPRQLANGTSLPATCGVGSIFFKSDATAGQNIYQCQSTNTWTQQLNSGSCATCVKTDQANTYGAFAQDLTAATVSLPAPWVATNVSNTYSAGMTQVFTGDGTNSPIQLLGGTFSSVTAGRVGINNTNGFVWANGTAQMQITNPATAARTLTLIDAAMDVLPRTSTANQVILSGSTAVPGWSPYTIPATIAAHQTLVAIGTTAVAAKTIPDCTDTGGNHINFTQSTDAFSCGTSGGGSSIYIDYQGQIGNVTVAAGSDTTIYQTTLPAIPSGKCVAVSFTILDAGTAATTYKLKLNTDSITIFTIASNSWASSIGQWTVCNVTGSQTTQILNAPGYMNQGGAIGAGPLTVAGTFAENLASAGVTLTLTGNSLAVTNTVTPEQWNVTALY